MRRFMSLSLLLLSAAFLLASTGNSQEVTSEKLDNPPRKLPASPPASPSTCCDAPAQKIIVEVPPPEIIIQRAGGFCAPESKGFLQRCNHYRMHQWTHVSGHGSPPVSGVPMVFAPQSFAPQSFAAQSFVPQSFVPQSFVPQSFAPQSFVAQSFVPQSFVPQSFAPQSFAPQSGTADDKLDIRTAVKNLSENMETASKLLKTQAQILKIHDDKISTIEATLKESESLLKATSNKKIFVDVDGSLKVKKE